MRRLTRCGFTQSLAANGLIIEPITLLRNQELDVSIPGVPPPLLAITYLLRCKGNSVYRIDGAEILTALPINDDAPAYVLGKTHHLIDAIESLGVESSRLWAGYCAQVDDSTSRFVAWAI